MFPEKGSELIYKYRAERRQELRKDIKDTSRNVGKEKHLEKMSFQKSLEIHFSILLNVLLVHKT